MEILIGDDNIAFTPEQLRFIRKLDDFDLTMFLSECCQHGWEPYGERLLNTIRDSVDNGTVELIDANR